MQNNRTPPHDTEAESSILGAILIQNSTLDTAVEEELESDDFFDPGHRLIFHAMLALFTEKSPVDLVTITAKLRAMDVFEKVGGTAKLTTLFDQSFTVAGVSAYIRIVRDRAHVRRMIAAGAEIAQEGFGAIDNPEEYIQASESKVLAVSDRKSARTFVSLSDGLISAVKVIEERAAQSGELFGLSTGFRDVDKLTGGLHPGQVTVLAARPGMGKTSFALNLAYNAAHKQRAVIALFSLEMTCEELTMRIIASASKIDSKRVKTGKLLDREWQKLAQAADQMSRCSIFIDQSAGLLASELASRSRRLKKAQGGKLDLIVIDYLQLMKPPVALQKGNVNEAQQLAEISKSIKELSKELSCPVLLLSQLNRQVESERSADKRPSLSHLRGSGAIEQDADAVVFIHRPGYYDKNCEDPNLAELIWAKNRHGEQATIKMVYLGQYTLFADLEENPLPGDRQGA